jgi:hypothetical protein
MTSLFYEINLKILIFKEVKKFLLCAKKRTKKADSRRQAFPAPMINLIPIFRVKLRGRPPEA